MLQKLLRIVFICTGLLAGMGAAVRAIFVMANQRKEMNCVCGHAVHLAHRIQNGKLLNAMCKMPRSLSIMVLLSVALNVQALTPPGTAIDNTAVAAFDFSGTGSTAASNIETVVTTIIQTPSSISLLQYDSTGTSGFTPTVVTQHATSGPPGTGFVVSADPVVPVIGSGVNVLDPADPQPLSTVSLYATGEPIFAQVDDRDQNLDPSLRETVGIIVTSSTGDVEELILLETEVDSGIFIGYVQSTSSTVAQYDGLLSLGAETDVSIQYTDQYDPSDISTGTALVDPYGVVFSSLDGTLLDGATVSILDTSGNLAAVFGDDGVSTYDNPVITGGSVTDSGGTLYDFPTGSYRFPRMNPGSYRIVVDPPASYQGPSVVSISDLQTLPGAPYALDSNASFAEIFLLQPGPPLHVDVPLDALSSYLVIEKSASKDTAAIGDFVQYTLNLSNTDTVTAANNVVITDTLPVGLRYQKSSVRYDGAPGAEPQVSGDGRTLSFPVSAIAAASSIQVKYVTEITVGTKLGKAVNSVIAQDDRGTQSNTAVAGIAVTEDLFASKSFIAGRVIVGECDDDSTLINPGLPSVRIFMEDGRYAATDEQGRFHFEGVNPGTHVVQVDKESIPDNLEIVECVKNTRYAGTPYSQFVDIQGGTLWRTDFYVREKKPITDTASFFIKSELNDEDIKYTIEMSNGEIPVKNYRLIVNLPAGIEFDPGSAVLDGVALEEPYVNDNVVVYRLGDPGNNWKKKLQFRGRIKERADGDLITSVFTMMDTATKKNIRSTPSKNKLEVARARKEDKTVVYQAYFEPMGTDLSYISKKGIREAVDNLGEVEITRNEITGYSDGLPVKQRSVWVFGDNTAMSEKRAKAVGDYLINDLGLDEDTVVMKGAGASEPVASNDTLEGRALNRRADLVITTSEVVGPGKVELVTSESEVSEVVLEGQPEFKIEKLIEAPPVTEQLDISAFDEFWIKDAVPGQEWLMPDPNYAPISPSVNIAIKHKPSDNFEMMFNGKPINPLFYFGMIRNKSNTVARSYWQGVHLVSGVNRFEFVLKDDDGKVIRTLTRDVVFADIPVRAELDAEHSRLIADGRNVPVIALRVYDKDGNFARPGSRGRFTLSEPYLPQQLVEAYQVNRLSGLNNEDPEYVVGQNGIAYIVLEPTTITGKLEIEMPFSGRKRSRIETWMQPEVRDWIMVGLAEGTAGYNAVSGNTEALGAADINDEFYSEGKVAFYAKGKVKGEWLLTTSYDTSKNTDDTDNRVNQMIDPNTYYTIYGDNSTQRYDASSADKLYIKMEREQFYAMYGDMNTGLSITELSKFQRNMTGVKSEFDSGKFAYTAFAAENKNNFIKDEIQGEGISGLYRLSGNDIVINSDNIVIETRDRFRSEIIIKSETMRRYLDYSIDYSDGTIFFRRPIPSRDESFNPIFIVADYEVEAPVDGDITAGGRAAARFNDGQIEVGATVVHDATYLNEGDLVGADARIEINSTTEARFEAAVSDVTSGTQDLDGSAYSAEIVHGGDNLKVRVYAKQQDEDFGLGQQSISQSGTRKYGADANYQVNRSIVLDGTVYHEDNLVTGGKRDVAEANVIYSKRDYSLNAGAVIARDRFVLGETNASNLLTFGASKNFLQDTVKLRANAEVAVDSADSNIDYPSRFILGADYFITSKVNLFAENEWTVGRDQDTQMARAGVRATPWTNAQINTAVNQETNESGIRSFATLGLTQTFPINKRWSGDVTFDHAKTLRTPGVVPFYDNVPIAQGTENNDFTAISVGTTYNAASYTLNNRVELRAADLEDKLGMIVNWERNLKGGVGYSATTKLFRTDRTDNSELLDGDIRFSVAYRPLQSRWITLNRLDFKFDSSTDILGIKTRQRKLIENLTSNYLIDNWNQVSFNFGLKYVVDTFDKAEYSGITNLLGTEYRHDLSDRFDVGVHAHTHYTTNSSTMKYSTGLSFGWNMSRNIWLSIGYNFDGFEDRDFSAAGYTATGPYIRFRMKFDQDTADEVQDMLN
ncbi:MAG: OmpA family protein [Gammaproteobacteria bacterium]|nr:OmpA family protein [Gammaproteobacteria bacterium]NNJ49161.1 OmpA family protein [Gammaproteobacteria bacterium]